MSSFSGFNLWLCVILLKGLLGGGGWLWVVWARKEEAKGSFVQ